VRVEQVPEPAPGGGHLVTSSLQFKDFAADLLDPGRLATLRDRQGLGLAVNTDGEAYVTARCAEFQRVLKDMPPFQS
jgi:hypothetical protein